MTTAPISLLVAGGGTGGHLYPGIAVARELLARAPGAQVSFVGTAAGIETRVVPREGFALDLIRSAGLKGKSVKALARGVGLLPLSGVDAWRVLSGRRPTVVIGVGGYSSGPVVLLAALRGVPAMLMEQNAVPGLTNRLLSSFVSAAAVTYPETARYFGPRAFVSGNPVRAEFFSASREARVAPTPAGPVRVLVFGGSQGAHAVNMAMLEAAPRLARTTTPLAVTHQTGDHDLQAVRDGYRRAGLDAEVEPFLFDMADRMRQADVVVCRAGATTLAELAAAGRPSVLVPLPSAADDHQRHNAEALVARGAAEMILQRELTGDRLAASIEDLAARPARRREMADAARALARPDAAGVIVDRLLELSRR